MTPKELAVQDMKNDLNKQGKSFLAFHNELNPIIRKLVSTQIKEQIKLAAPRPVAYRREIMARCLFCKGEVKFENYSKYYEN